VGVDSSLLTIVQGRVTRFRIRIRRDGDPFSLASENVRAGIQSDKSTAISSAGFKALAVGTYSAAGGILSATYGGTGVNFTGAAALVVTRRISTGPTAVEILQGPVPVLVRAAYGDGARLFG
jgi:hypothetical protein